MFAKVSGNEVIEYPINPVHEFPHMSFPPDWKGGIIGNHNYVIVERTLPPDSGLGKVVTEGTPVLEDKVWKQTWNVSYKDLEDHKKEIKEWLADYRFKKETGGVIINSALFATDRESQTKYIAIAIDLASADLKTFSIKWKSNDGKFQTLNGYEMYQAINTVRSHIQECYNKEAEYLDLIEKANSELLISTDFTLGWPK